MASVRPFVLFVFAPFESVALFGPQGGTAAEKQGTAGGREQVQEGQQGAWLRIHASGAHIF